MLREIADVAELRPNEYAGYNIGVNRFNGWQQRRKPPGVWDPAAWCVAYEMRIRYLLLTAARNQSVWSASSESRQDSPHEGDERPALAVSQTVASQERGIRMPTNRKRNNSSRVVVALLVGGGKPRRQRAAAEPDDQTDPKRERGRTVMKCMGWTILILAGLLSCRVGGVTVANDTNSVTANDTARIRLYNPTECAAAVPVEVPLGRIATPGLLNWSEVKLVCDGKTIPFAIREGVGAEKQSSRCL